MRDLIIIGAGGFGREVAWLVERINSKQQEWKLRGFIDDSPNMQGKVVNSYPVLGTLNDIKDYHNCYFVCAVGSVRIREKIIAQVLAADPYAKFATLIDPSVEMSPLVKIGDGTIICAHTILTVNIEIGRHVIINLDCTVGHDTVIQDLTTVYPSANLSGMTKIGRLCEIGTGVQIIQGKTIGAGTVVGAGAVVVKDLPEKCTAVGSPAKPIKFFE